MTNALLSYDVELLPENFTKFSTKQMAQYDYNLGHLGTKSHPYTDYDRGMQGHPDALFTEFAPLLPYDSSDALLADFIVKKQRARMWCGYSLYGVDWIDVAGVPTFTESTCPTLYPLSFILGCSEDFYKGRARTVPEAVKKSTVKEGGIHFHLNLMPKFCDNAQTVQEPVQELDDAVRFLMPEWTGPRPPWYRVPGVYRPKSYGVEYRSFGASIVNNEGKFATLVKIMFLFMQDHIKTHSRSYHV